MHNHVDRLDTAFPIAGAVSLELIQQAEVSDQWLRPSALPKMSIGALACHLGRQIVRAADLLPVATDVPPLDSIDAHYRWAAWVTSNSPDDPSNDRSMPADQHHQFEEHVRSMYKQMARISIEPRWARYYDFGAGRVPEFLRKLANGN